MKHITIDTNSESVEFKFMANNRAVASNNNLRNSIAEYGIVEEVHVVPLADYDGCLNEEMTTILGSGEKVDSYVVLDGQHRLSCYKDILDSIQRAETINATDAEKPQKIVVPKLGSRNIPVKVLSKADIKRYGGIDNYVIMLNNTSKKWTNNDYITNAYQRNTQSMDLRIINAWTKGKMSISTISRWVSGNTKAINAKSLQTLAEGKSVVKIDCVNALKLYLQLHKLGFSKSFLNKRYMIDAVNDLYKATPKDEVLFVLGKIESFTEIENANYVDGDVVSQIKAIIRRDYDAWRSHNNLTVEQEKRQIGDYVKAMQITDADIEDFLSDSIVEASTSEIKNAA